MNKYLKTLELDKILEMLENEASNEKTKEMIRKIEPVSDISEVKKEMQKTVDAFELSVKNGNPPFFTFKDVSASLKKASSGASITLAELLRISTVLKQIDALISWFNSCGEVNTSVNYLFEALIPNTALEKRISESVLSEDELADTASVQLGEIRRKISRASLKVRDNLDKMLKSSEVTKSLQENIVTLRDGRYVLPVKSDSRGNVRGIVHASSASGSTLFIEPESVVEANNDIQILKDREKEEIERIIAELSHMCGSAGETIISGIEICAEINFYFAKSNLAAKMKASAPIISYDKAIILKQARHPLIDPKKVVPVDISLGEKYDTMIITGPNTGGKTVALKTTGLMCAMVMCGLMIPALESSRVSVFDDILVCIGDMQSIENELSTFSSHMKNVVEICEKADNMSLVLLDELGSGTDPSEGAALAQAVIENLRTWSCRIIVTTHYEELKIYAIEENGVENASFEFDPVTFKPTYKLLVGTPGKSNAFYISKGLGISDDIIKRAGELMSEESIHIEDVIGKLEKSRKEYEDLKDEISSTLEENKRIQSELQIEKERFEKNKNNEFEKARIEAMKIVEMCRAKSDMLLNELKKTADVKEAKSLAKSVTDKMYLEANPVKKSSDDSYTPPRPLRKGDNVYIVTMNKNGILMNDPDKNGNVFVESGVIRTKTSVKNLKLIDKKEEPKSKTKILQSPSITRTKSKQTANSKRPLLEIDIRGMNVDEGIVEVDSFIDRAVMNHAGMVTIIHGKGTGVLREGIQRHLKRNPSVKSFRNGIYGEGEEGVTVVELKS